MAGFLFLRELAYHVDAHYYHAQASHDEQGCGMDPAMKPHRIFAGQDCYIKRVDLCTPAEEMGNRIPIDEGHGKANSVIRYGCCSIYDMVEDCWHIGRISSSDWTARRRQVAAIR